MLQPRAALMSAIKTLTRARTADERQLAAKEAVGAVEVYLDSDEVHEGVFADPAFVDKRPQLRSKALGGRDAPLRHMSADQVAEFNDLLPWAAQTVDPEGRVVGEAWSAKKRNAVARLVEPRQTALNEVFPLAGRHVLEVGCFEGIHTISLMLLGAVVTACDGRVENAMKTLARTWAYGLRSDVVLWDLEQAPPSSAPEAWDVLHHIGVLYHLSNPVEHLSEFLPKTRHALLLDTHVASDDAGSPAPYVVDGHSYRFRHKPELFIASSPFAGMRDHAKYLVVSELIELIERHGFADIRLIDDRDERNGRRVTIWAFREKQPPTPAAPA